MMETVKQELRTSKINPLIIPGGCTKYIQAHDVVWNKPFKANVTEKYDEWMAGEAHSFTAAGNMRALPWREIVGTLRSELSWGNAERLPSYVAKIHLKRECPLRPIGTWHMMKNRIFSYFVHSYLMVW